MSEQRKNTSIVNDIIAGIRRRRVIAYVITDVALFLSAFFGYIVACENSVGAFSVIASERRISNGLIYIFSPENSDEVFTFPLSGFVAALSAIMIFIFVVQLLIFFLTAGKDDRYVRAKLRPIDEIALAAEELSARNFDEAKLRDLENEIDKISSVVGEARVSVADKDLDGLENAVNNMLSRISDSYRAQTRFVDDASHELRTPIAVIKGYVDMLDRWGKDDPKIVEEAVDAIKTESNNMQHLVDSLLFLARGDMGRQIFEPKPVELSEMLTEIRDEFEMIDKNNIYRTVIYDKVTVNVDEALLKQAIRILSENAAKYTPDGGLVTLRLLKKESGEISIDVQDNGCGIAPEDIPHIFERFYRSDSARATKPGSGLGLSIAKWIVDRHGGRFEVMSYVNVGTRISILLPASTVIS